MNDLSLLTDKITNLNLNDDNQSDDSNSITKLIDTVKSDYQSNIILNLFTDISNKMYLVDHREDVYNIEVDVLGSKKTKNSREMYTIVFNKSSNNFTCNCKDFTFRSKSHGIVCKHITFIVCKVLLVLDPVFFDTKNLSDYDEKKMLNIIGNSKIWYNNNISIKHINSEFKSNKKRVLDINEQCPICCDCFSNKETVSCPECFNYVHKDCIDIWMTKSNKCIYCRNSVWSNYIKDIDNI